MQPNPVPRVTWNPMAEVEQLLDRWRFTACSDGTVWISPRHSPVSFGDFGVLFKRLHAAYRSDRVGRLMLVFDEPLCEHHRWSDMRRLVADFAGRRGLRWRVDDWSPGLTPVGAECLDVRAPDCWIKPKAATVRVEETMTCIVLETGAAGTLGDPRMLPAAAARLG